MIPLVSAKILGSSESKKTDIMAKIKFVVSATIEETFSDFIISKKQKDLFRYLSCTGRGDFYCLLRSAMI